MRILALSTFSLALLASTIGGVVGNGIICVVSIAIVWAMSRQWWLATLPLVALNLHIGVHIVTSTLIGGGHVPRKVIGSVNLTEFFVTVVTSITLVVTLGVADLTPVIPLIIGGLVVAPFAGYVVRIVPARWMMLAVGALIVLLSGRGILKIVGLL